MLRKAMMAVAVAAMLASPALAQSPGRTWYRSGNTWFSFGSDGVRTTILDGARTYRYFPNGSSSITERFYAPSYSPSKSFWDSLLKK